MADSNDNGYVPFVELEESMFPNNEGDYASSYMNPDGATNELNRQRKLPNYDWELLN